MKTLSRMGKNNISNFTLMDAVDLALKAAIEISNNLKRVADIAVKQSTGKMLDLNENQLDRGILNTGQNISPEYSPFTRKKKGRRIPDLLDTGAFRNSFFIDVGTDSLKFNATDSKTTKLKAKYSQDILGLTTENAQKVFNDEIYPKENEFINKVVKKYY